MGTWFETATFSCVKAGNDPRQYEDYAASSSNRGVAARPGRFAVADGATVSAFAKEWAMALAEAFVSSKGTERRSAGWLARAQRRWAAQVGSQPLPWNVAAKVEQGAYAALAGLHLCRRLPGRQQGTYTMLAVGDACLFHVRGNTLRRAFPLTRPDLFGSTPQLLCSVSHPEKPTPRLQRVSGVWQPGDHFLLMSDAIAAWFLQETADCRQPWRWFERASHLAQEPDAFPTYIEDLRKAKRLKNDDVTVLTVWVDGG